MNSNNLQQPPPSPMQPVAPPSKKQRSNQPPLRGGRDALSTATDDAIARRRAELRRLQEKQTQQQDAKLLDQARSQLGGGGGAAMPPQKYVARARHSDIFPNVAKSTAPPPTSRKQPTPRVARRLDPSFEEKKARSRSAPPMRPPPPPVPPPLVAEAPPERSPTSEMQQEETPPSTVRRETFRNLRDMAPAPSDDVQLVKELKLAQDEKADALRKVARLKEQIQQLQKPQIMSPQQSVSQVAFLSPLNASATPSQGSRSAPSPALLGSSTRKRVSTPHPKSKNSDTDDNKQFLQEAASSVPYEYTSTLATYIVRRPYVSSPDEPWNTAGTRSAHEYQASLDVNTAATLEVCAKISADDSLLTLSDVSTVRHQNASTKQWKVFENVDDMDKPLGCVMYIDSDASEKEYWLDAIYEEAFAAREAYCTSLISAAAVLQARNAEGIAAASPGLNSLAAQPQPMPSHKPQVTDACVGTDDSNVSGSQPQAEKTAAPPKRAPTKELEQEPPSGNLLSALMGMMFRSLFGLVVLVLIRIPYRIFTFSLLLVTTSAFLSILWLYVADDHGAQLMGAGVQYGFNPPGIV